MSTSYLQRLVEVMDQLRSPGGCPWDAEQTHESLIKYLLEESYEFIDTVAESDRAGMREELGDVLLQVYFHSRIAQDHQTDPFSIEDVAQIITEKLISRHPHVFGDKKVSGSDEVVANWEEIKAAEKGRTSALDGVAISQPALSLINKLLYRAEKYGVDITVPKHHDESSVATSESVGNALLAVIAWAHKNGIDPEDALRMQSKQLMREIAQQEAR
jgi:XTP/dITP diphosphohydrolase